AERNSGGGGEQSSAGNRAVSVFDFFSGFLGGVPPDTSSSSSSRSSTKWRFRVVVDDLRVVSRAGPSACVWPSPIKRLRSSSSRLGDDSGGRGTSVGSWSWSS